MSIYLTEVEAFMADFTIADYLKSIVGNENYQLDQALHRFDTAKQKGNQQVTTVWALVLAMLYLEIENIEKAQEFLSHSAESLKSFPDPGLQSLCDYLSNCHPK
jgi:hypothetical protein